MSRWFVGSSRSRTSGSVTRARASSTRRFLPAESVPAAFFGSDSLDGGVEPCLLIGGKLLSVGFEVERSEFGDVRTNVRDAVCNLREDRSAFGVGDVLRERRQAGSGFKDHGAVVGLEFAADQLQERGFARAVSTDESDSFATFYMDRYAVQQDWVRERKGHVFNAEECHARECSGLNLNQKPAVSSSLPANFNRSL